MSVHPRESEECALLISEAIVNGVLARAVDRERAAVLASPTRVIVPSREDEPLVLAHPTQHDHIQVSPAAIVLDAVTLDGTDST